MAQWDAFISYARSASTLEAQKLQTAIQTFAKPWYRLRAVRIFRDDSSMSANPALWSSIEQGLSQARWLVVLLSQAAARSEYVAAEIRWWLQHKDSSTILLVHDDGVLAWDRARNDFAADADCVPVPLRGAFREEPRWTDLSWFDEPGSSGAADPRFAEKVADLAATIRGLPRDELLGEDVAQHKRSWRLARTAIGLLSLLLIASVVASIIAIAQRNEVQRQANSLLARQLAATADSLLTRDLRRAQLLAVQAYRTDPTTDTRAALLRATVASPALRRFVPLPAAITALSASADGRFVVAGLQNGEVYSWDVATTAPAARLKLAAAVQNVGISSDGQVLAAVDGTSAYVATGSTIGSLVAPAGSEPDLVAVSPSGHGIMIGSHGRDAAYTTLVDLARRSQRSVPDPLSSGGGYGTLTMQFSADDQVVLTGGKAQRRTFPGFALVAQGDLLYGNHQTPGRLSGNGVFATAVNGSSEVPVWPIDGDQDRPPRYAVVPMANERAAALNYDGTLVAVADGSGIHLATVLDTSAPSGFGHAVEPPRVFEGLTEVNYDGLLFLGRTSRVVAASGSDLSLWDPEAFGRTTTSQRVAVPNACVACGSPTTMLSPDGSTMAVRDGDHQSLLVASVPGRSGNLALSYAPAGQVGSLGPPVWLDDAAVLLVASGDPEGTLTGPLPGLPPGVVGWAVGHPTVQVIDVGLSADKATALVVSADGHIGRYDARTGALQAETVVPPPVSDFGSSWFDAAVDDQLTSVALTPGSGPMRVVDLATAGTRYTVDVAGDSVSRSLFADGALWVRLKSGAIERRDPATGALQSRIPGRLTVRYDGTLASGSGLLSIPTDLGVSLYDVGSQALLGSTDLPEDWLRLRRGTAIDSSGTVVVTVFESSGEMDSLGLALATELDPEKMVGVACRTSGGSLSAGDWQVLVGGPPPADLTCR